MIRSGLVLLGVVLTLSACSSPAPSSSGAEQWRGYGTIANERLLPIKTSLNLESDPPTGVFVVADEQTEIPEIILRGDSMIFEFAEYGARMRGLISDDEFAGVYERFREDTTGFPFVLFRTERAFPYKSDSTASGVYRVFLERPAGVDSSSVATIQVADTMMIGTIIAPSGDYGVLEGTARDADLQFSRFTGWQAIYLELTPLGLGYHGNLYTRAESPVPVLLRPAPQDASETGPVTRMRDSESSFRFSGITPEGDTLSSDDARFQNNPIVVDIMGTWCHNCLDAAPLLERAYEEHRDEGLQVVSLSFEISDDTEKGLENLRRFSERFDASFPVLYAGSLDPENVNERLHSQLENFFSYPTTLFIDRNGRVVEIHTGFNGPGTGERFEEEKRQFETAVGRIL